MVYSIAVSLGVARAGWLAGSDLTRVQRKTEDL